MRLFRDTEAPDGASLKTFRASWLGTLIAAVFFTIAIAGGCAALTAASRELPWWGWIPFAPFALLVATLMRWILAAVWGAFAASLRASNWAMRVGKGGVWLHLRSYQNHAFEDADETAAYFGFDEIEGARKVVERQSMGMSGDSEASVAFLELLVAPSLTDDLQRAVQVERLRDGPERSFLGIKSRTRSQHVPVFVADPGRVRVQWHGRSMLRVLEQNGVAILEKIRGGVKHGGVSTEDVDGEIIGLIERGRKLRAIGLVRETYGMGLADAKAFVEDLSDRPAA